MLTLNNINVILQKNTQLQKHVLRDLNLQVNDGEFVIIIGGNGCGKSTLFNTISAYIKPDSGNIIINGIDVSEQAQTKRSHDVAVVMQEPRIGTMENMTIEENLSFAFLRDKPHSIRLHNTTKKRELFRDKLAMLNMGLEARLDTLVGGLSGGQRQALSLIMAIVADYKILLLDEITAALDPKTAENVMEIAAKLVQIEKKTAIMITHNMQHALRYGNRTILMADGKIIREYNAETRLKITPLELTAAFNEV